MEQEYFEMELKRIDAAGIRTFKKGHINLLYNELKDIPDVIFHKIVNEYISFEGIAPKMIGFFKSKETELKKEMGIDSTKKVLTGIPAGEYTETQQKMFNKCFQLAIFKMGGGSEEYGYWVKWFNGQWNKLSGESLTLFLNGHYKKLLEADIEQLKLKKDVV